MVENSRREGRVLESISRGKRFAVSASGASTVEYACLLAMILCGGLMVGGSARLVAAHLERTAGQGLSHATTFASNVSRNTPPRRTPNTDSVQAGPAFAGHGGWLLLGFGLGVVLLSGWGVRHKRRRRLPAPSPSESEEMAGMSARERKSVFAKRQQILHVLNNDRAALLKSRIQVRHLMSHDLLTARPDTPAEQVLQVMRENQVRHMLVCNDGRELVGVVSDRDLRTRAGRIAADLMTPDPITASPDDPAGQIITLMMHRHISCVPVVDRGRLCGVLTSTDMMMALHCTLQILARAAAGADASSQLAATACTDLNPEPTAGGSPS